MGRIIALLLVLLAAAGTGWWLLGRPDRATTAATVAVAADAPLQFVPADTPFVFASLAPLPASVVARWEDDAGLLQQAWQAQFEQWRAHADTEALGADAQAWLRVIEREFADVPPRQAFESLGFSIEQPWALYGLGVLPVLRIGLAAPERLEAFIGRLEQERGQAFPQREAGGRQYRLLASPEDDLAVLLAISDRQLVVSLVPSQVEAERVHELLGLQRPARPLAASGELQRFADASGYLPFLVGYVDSARLLQAVTGPASPLEQAFADVFGLQKPALDATCTAEWEALAATWPRLGFGYTRLDERRIDTHLLLQARDDIAAELVRLRAPMPGLAAVDEATLLHFGVAMDVAAVPEVVGRLADRIEQQPWQCPSLAALNDMARAARSQVASPAVYAAAPVLSSLHIAIAGFGLGDMADAMASLRGRLVIGSANPSTLLAMAAPMLPGLADLDLQVDGPAQPLPALPGVTLDAPVHVALGRTALALTIGDGEESRLPALLQADPGGQPLLAAGIGSGFYRSLGQQFGQLAEQMAAADPARRVELERDLARMQQMYSQMIQHVETRLELTEHGIELHSATTLQPD